MIGFLSDCVYVLVLAGTVLVALNLWAEIVGNRRVRRR